MIGATTMGLLKSKKYFIGLFGSRRMTNALADMLLTTQWCSDWNIGLDDINDTQIDIEMPDDLKF
jgi:hypothetical protein